MEIPLEKQDPAARRRAFIVCLRNCGYTYAQIGERLGISGQRVYGIIKHELAMDRKRVERAYRDLQVVQWQYIARSGGERSA